MTDVIADTINGIFGIGGFFGNIASALMGAISMVINIIDILITLSIGFVAVLMWSISHILVLLMMIEICILFLAISKRGFSESLEFFVKTNMYLIQMIAYVFFTLLNNVINLIAGLIP